MDIEALNEDLMRTENLHDPSVQKPRIDLGKTLGKNSLVDRVVRPTRKFIKLVIKISSKVREPKTYNETINNLVYGNK